MKMGAAISSNISVTTDQSVRRHISELKLRYHRCENVLAAGAFNCLETPYGARVA